jgi:hypothetical protein
LSQATSHRPATDHLFTATEQQRREDVITKEVNISGRDNVKGKDMKGSATVTCLYWYWNHKKFLFLFIQRGEGEEPCCGCTGTSQKYRVRLFLSKTGYS